MKRIDLPIGSVFGDWTVTGKCRSRGGRLYARCRCVCGTSRLVLCTDLRSGKSTGCRCTSTAKPSDNCLVCFGLPHRRRRRGLCKCGEKYAPLVVPTAVQWLMMPHENQRVA
jgi:hypothetical protein